MLDGDWLSAHFIPSPCRNSNVFHVPYKPSDCCPRESGLALLRRCIAQHPITASFDDALKFIDSAKARLTSPISTNPDLEAIYSIYQETLASEGAMDFADIVLTVVQKMHTREMLPLPIRWLLVDEAQDMDEVQMEWVKAHGLAGIEVSLVGDDDQSLYAFRHAMGYLGLTDVSSTLVSTETTLPLNYRCAPNILGTFSQADRPQQAESTKAH
jgi:superfamily I DNA/RNA helicase